MQVFDLTFFEKVNIDNKIDKLIETMNECIL